MKGWVARSCLTVCDPMDYRPARLLCPWDTPGKNTGVIPFSKRSSRPRDWTQISCIAGRFFTIWTFREAPSASLCPEKLAFVGHYATSQALKSYWILLPPFSVPHYFSLSTYFNLISYHSNCRKSIFAKILTSLKECSNLTLKLPLLVCLGYNRCCCFPWNFKMFHMVSLWVHWCTLWNLGTVWELPLRSVAAAKSLQSCPTLCDPIDGSPPGSAVPGILQARTLEWVAISFSNAWKWKAKVKSLSCPTLSDPMDCWCPLKCLEEWLPKASHLVKLLYTTETIRDKKEILRLSRDKK